MNSIDFGLETPETLSVPLTPDDSLNGNYTAIPKGFEAAGTDGIDLDLVVDGMEYGEMNEPEAIESGYVSGAQADLNPQSLPVPGPRSTTAARSFLVPAVGLGTLVLLGWGLVSLLAKSRAKV